MKTVFDKTTREELIARINSLKPGNIQQWGKMNVVQMIEHCILWDEMVLGKKHYKQAFIGKLFGKFALKGIIKDEAPLTRNTPTIPEFIIKHNKSEISDGKKKWCELIIQYEKFSNPGFIHPFFGKMTEEQIGIMAYKHSDHHLRQFNS